MNIHHGVDIFKFLMALIYSSVGLLSVIETRGLLISEKTDILISFGLGSNVINLVLYP